MPLNVQADSRDPLGRRLLVVTTADAGVRLDRYLVPHFPDLSRSRLSSYIRARLILVNDRAAKGGYRLRPGDRVTVELPAPEPAEPRPQPMDLQIIHEDEHLLVLNKPPGLVVHPAAGHADSTLVNALLHHCDRLPGRDRQRPGIVHRLDKDTSGIMLVAKNDLAMQRLGEAFSNREVTKNYLAVLLRTPVEPEGRIVAPIGRHPVQRKKMAVRPANGRFAATNWRILERYENGMCLAEIRIETGRTHQIRVHMQYQSTPVAGDPLYGGRVDSRFQVAVDRQLLHASAIAFPHPDGSGVRHFVAPLWPDMENVIGWLRTIRIP